MSAPRLLALLLALGLWAAAGHAAAQPESAPPAPEQTESEQTESAPTESEQKEAAAKTDAPLQQRSLWQRLRGRLRSEAQILEAPSPIGEISIGQADAPIVMVEYSSLTCPHCSAFHALNLPRIKAQYVAPGHLRILFRHFPFDPQGTAGAMLAQCAAPAQRAGFLDVLFVRQRDWVLADEPMQELQKFARAIGMTEDAVLACWRNEEILAGIRQMQKDAYEVLEVRSTPTFFINGKRYEGNMRFAKFAEAFAPFLPDDAVAGDAP